MFFCLKDADIHTVYRKASAILSERGMSKTLTYDPYTKSVDVEGALLLACGASEKLLDTDSTDIASTGIPEANIVKILLGVEYIEAMIDDDLPHWCSEHETEDAIKMLNKLADRIEVSIVKQKD